MRLGYSKEARILDSVISWLIQVLWGSINSGVETSIGCDWIRGVDAGKKLYDKPRKGGALSIYES